MINEQVNRLIAERNMFEILSKQYRSRISEARRLINIDEVGLADAALSCAERFKVSIVGDGVTSAVSEKRAGVK